MEPKLLAAAQQDNTHSDTLQPAVGAVLQSSQIGHDAAGGPLQGGHRGLRQLQCIVISGIEHSVGPTSRTCTTTAGHTIIMPVNGMPSKAVRSSSRRCRPAAIGTLCRRPLGVALWVLLTRPTLHGLQALCVLCEPGNVCQTSQQDGLQPQHDSVALQGSKQVEQRTAQLALLWLSRLARTQSSSDVL